MTAPRHASTLLLSAALTATLAGCSSGTQAPVVNGSPTDPAGPKESAVAFPNTEQSPATSSSTAATATQAVGQNDFCSVLNQDPDAAATIFMEVTYAAHDEQLLNRQIHLLEQVQMVPAGLEDDIVTWRGYQQSAKVHLNDFKELMLAYDLDAQTAGDALFDAYYEHCFTDPLEADSEEE